jgi:hypothetical protein
MKPGGGMTAFAQWLAGTSASMAVQKTLWLIALMQTIHILCVARERLPWTRIAAHSQSWAGTHRSRFKPARDRRAPRLRSQADCDHTNCGEIALGAPIGTHWARVRIDKIGRKPPIFKGNPALDRP